MKSALFLLVVMASAGGLRAEVVFSNLNSSSSASVGSGFTNYAQRFTTASAGLGLQVDLNVVSLAGSQPYAVELWSSNVAGTNVNALLTTIGSGTVTSSDKTAVTTFNTGFSLDAATNYFIKIIAASGNFGVALGPSTSTALNSVVRYGVGNLNNTSDAAIGMKVDVAAVPEPGTVGLVGVAASGAAIARSLRRRKSPRSDHASVDRSPERPGPSARSRL